MTWKLASLLTNKKVNLLPTGEGESSWFLLQCFGSFRKVAIPQLHQGFMNSPGF